MKIYISGAITGIDINHVKAKFKKVERYLNTKYTEVVNPLEIQEIKDGKSWDEYLICDIKELLSCDAIFMLKDWKESKGARIEFSIAIEIGLKIYFE